MFSQVVQEVKNTHAHTEETRDIGFILWWGRSPGGGNGNPSQYSCLENPMDRGGWWATVVGRKESDTTEVTQRSRYLCNRTLSPEIDSYKYSQMIFDKTVRAI